MKTIAHDIKLLYNKSKQPLIILSVKGNFEKEIQGFKELIIKGKTLNIEIKKHTNRRSLDSNAYLWVILNEMAAKLNTTKDELYIIMLDRYGVFTHIIVKPGLVEKGLQQVMEIEKLKT